MNYRSKVIADSVGPNLVRLTTLEFDIWKPLLAEFNTHGLLASRNFPSSRAIPWAKMRDKILSVPHIPFFRKNNPGMQPAEPLSDKEQAQAETYWLELRDAALQTVEIMGDKEGLNIHKQWLNRCLEPWITVTGLVTATDWDNFFNLRLELNDSCYPMAQDEFYFMARAMKKSLEESSPVRLEPGELHIPYVSEEYPAFNTVTELAAFAYKTDYFANDVLCMVSAGRCATVSYDNLGEGLDTEKDFNRAVKVLLPFGHMSVFQHQAICLPESSEDGISADGYNTAGMFSGQLRGWTQFRKTLPNEELWVSPNAGRELALSLPELITI
jgi:hypothetical protein